MSTTQPGDILKVTARMTQTDTGAIQNVFTLRWEALLPSDDGPVMTHVAQHLDDLYQFLKPHMAGNVLFTDVTGFNHTQNRPMPSANWPVLTAGTGSGDRLPPGVSALAFFRTGLSRVLGRKFFGPIQEGDNTDGFISSALLADVVNIIGGILAGDTSILDGGHLRHGVLDKGGTFRELTDGTASTNPAYQRRRRSQRGV